MLLAVTPPHTDAVDNVSLLGLVAKAASLVRARRARGAVDDAKLAILPAPVCRGQFWLLAKIGSAMYTPHTEEETEDIRLLFLVQLTNVLVSPHGEL